MSPRLASGMPKVAWSAATTRSHESMISKPPASAEPLTAAMIGLGKSRWVRPPKPPLAPMMSPPSPLLNALRSMPALNALSPLPVITTTQHSSSSASSSMKADIAVLTAPLMALRASGRLMVRISTLPAAFPQHFVCHGAPSARARPGPSPAAPPRLTGAAGEGIKKVPSLRAQASASACRATPHGWREGGG